MMMRIRLLLTMLLFASQSFAAPGAHGPDGEHISSDSASHKGALGRQADGSVIMPMPDQVMLDIRTRFVTPEQVSASVRLAGVVRAHAQGHAVIQPGSDGRLQAGKDGIPLSGKKVSAGEVLGYISYQDSAYELASQTSELLSIRHQIAQTKRDVRRLQEMGELASQQAVEQLQTQLKSLIEQETQLSQGLEQPQILIAPISGVLINHQVSNGQWVEAGTTLFEIIAPDKRRIEALTNDSSLVQQLSSAEIEGHGQLELSYMGHSPRLSSGMITLHFESISDEDQTSPLLIDQPVTLLAQRQQQIEGIVLPAEAIVRSGANLPIVWIKVSAQRFMPQVVSYQDIGGSRVVITKGLGADNRVVVSGTSLLNQVR
jgi:membrane fusion protein, heavy metal efflux system